jgi:hypothetical protein
MVLYCSDCGTEREFERPPCLDGHGADCPEYFCVECGYALLFGVDIEVLVTAEARFVA